MQLRAWFDDFSDTIKIDEYNSSGDGIVGAALLVPVLMGLFIAPVFIPFYFLCRYCNKEPSIAQREHKRAIGNMIICLCFIALRLCLHLTGPETPDFLTWIIMWIHGTSPLAMFISSCCCLVTSIKSVKKAKTKNEGKKEMSRCWQAIAINVGMIILVRIIIIF